MCKTFFVFSISEYVTCVLKIQVSEIKIFIMFDLSRLIIKDFNIFAEMISSRNLQSPVSVIFRQLKIKARVSRSWSILIEVKS